MGFSMQDMERINAARVAELPPLTREQTELLVEPLIEAAVRRALWNVLAAAMSISGLALMLYHGRESMIGSWSELAFKSGFCIWFLFGSKPR